MFSAFSNVNVMSSKLLCRCNKNWQLFSLVVFVHECRWHCRSIWRLHSSVNRLMSWSTWTQNTRLQKFLNAASKVLDQSYMFSTASLTAKVPELLEMTPPWGGTFWGWNNIFHTLVTGEVPVVEMRLLDDSVFPYQQSSTATYRTRHLYTQLPRKQGIMTPT